MISGTTPPVDTPPGYQVPHLLVEKPTGYQVPHLLVDTTPGHQLPHLLVDTPPGYQVLNLQDIRGTTPPQDIKGTTTPKYQGYHQDITYFIHYLFGPQLCNLRYITVMYTI